jgi:hypothetical protein
MQEQRDVCGAELSCKLSKKIGLEDNLEGWVGFG